MRIAILDDYLGVAKQLADWSAIERRAEVVVFDRHITAAEAPAVLGDFDALCHLRERMAMPRSVIAGLPRLKFIAVTGRRHRTLDLAAAHERGIIVSGTPDNVAGAHGTPELAWGLMLALTRHIPASDASMRRGGWQVRAGNVLNGKTLGVIGLGRLGQRMVPIAHGFGMRVLAWSPNLKPEAAAAVGATWVPRDQLLADSDFVSLHLVLSERSRNTLGARELALMKPTACLINTARAGLVDQQAMLDALLARRIAGAGLDVYETEPLPVDHPLRTLDNVVLTPHLGYTVEESLRVFYTGMVASLGAWLDGAPIHVVTE